MRAGPEITWLALCVCFIERRLSTCQPGSSSTRAVYTGRERAGGRCTRGTSCRLGVRDRSLINHGEGGGATKWEKSRVQKFLRPPPPSRQGKTFLPLPPPLFFLKGGDILCPHPNPIRMAKTSSSCVQTTSKPVVFPLQHGYNFFCPPPPFFVGVKLHLPQRPPPPPV